MYVVLQGTYVIFQSYVFCIFFRSYVFFNYKNFQPYAFIDYDMFKILYVGVVFVHLVRFQQISCVLSAFLFVCIMNMLFLKSLILFHANVEKKTEFCINTQLSIHLHCIYISTMHFSLKITSTRNNTDSHKTHGAGA